MPNTAPPSIIILAAGKGTRMKSSLAKVLHPVFNRPMIQHVLTSCQPLHSPNQIVIVGHQQEQVMASLALFDCTFVEQKEQLGTAHAVLMAKEAISEQCRNVMILCGDTPLIRSETLSAMQEKHLEEQATLTFMTTHLENPSHYGRVLSDDHGAPLRIVEEKDANAVEKAITEINAGVYLVDKNFLFQALDQVGSNNSQGEFYLTDIVELAILQGKHVKKFVCQHAQDVLGVNSRVELAEAEQELRLRHNKKIMMTGVSMLSPTTTCISEQTIIGGDTRLGAGVELRGCCTIGSRCVIDSGVILTNCTVADDVTIGAYSCLSDLNLAKDSLVPSHSTTFSL